MWIITLQSSDEEIFKAEIEIMKQSIFLCAKSQENESYEDA